MARETDTADALTEHRTPDSVKALGAPLVAAITALTIAMVGFFGNRALKQHDQANLYAQIVAAREQSESDLRKDMFLNMMTEFFKERESAGKGTDYSKRLLQLEMLALNFGESMTMGPLFQELASDIRGAHATGQIITVDLQMDIERLEKLAKRVSAWQLAALPKKKLAKHSFIWEPDKGKVWDSTQTVTLPSQNSDNEFTSPENLGNKFTSPENLGNKFTSPENLGNEFTSPEDSGNNFTTHPDSETLNPATQADRRAPKRDRRGPGNGEASKHSKSRWVVLAPVEGIRREVKIELSNPDVRFKTVTAKVTYRKLVDKKGKLREEGRDNSPIPLVFTLDFFDFPLIDNVRLGDGQRLALLLDEFDNNHLEVVVAFFPGRFGSQRDKPFLDVIMQQLPKIVDNE